MKRKFKKTTPGPWTPKHIGYLAAIDGRRFVIIAADEEMLRIVHKRVFAGEHPFIPKYLKPVRYQTIGV